MHPLKPIAAAAAMLTLLSAAPGLPALEQGTFLPPDIGQFLLTGGEDADGDGDGVRETHILHYRDRAGDTAYSMTSGGRLWAWSLASHGDGARPDRNYVIRDSDCDGSFDERYGLDEEYRVPGCLGPAPVPRP